MRSGTIWSDIVFDAEHRGCLFHAKDNEDFAKVISEVKTGLDQMDDLLNPSSALVRSASWKVSNDTLLKYKFNDWIFKFLLIFSEIQAKKSWKASILI